MSKADETKEMIVRHSAALFNQRGYSGTSISDVMEATGLKKGGIYNHFDSKDALAIEAFDYAYGLLRERYGTALRSTTNPVEQLLAMVDVFARTVEEPPVAGGCPILNTAIDSDDAHPALRERVRAALDEWRETMVRIVARGKRKGVFREEVDAEALATLIIATMEGALMVARLYGDSVHVERARGHLVEHIRTRIAS